MVDYKHGIALPQKIVVIGGGTGNSTVLSGLTGHIRDGLTAVVNTFDDGGGTGELRKVYPGLPAVGDLRQCFDAMSHASEGLRYALSYRHDKGNLSDKLNVFGQTEGNLIITASVMSQLEHGGDFSSALSVVSEIFQITGQVVPVSNDSRTLRLDLPDGKSIIGEHTAEGVSIDSFMGARISFNEGDAKISEAAKEAIISADIVVLAPGDLYTSIGPNLAVGGMREALEQARVVILVSNLMNRDRHTVGFTTADYVEEYTRLIGSKVIDRVIYNTGTLNVDALKAQANIGSYPVEPDLQRLEAEGYIARGFDMLSRRSVVLDPKDEIAASRSIIRHDSALIADALISVFQDNGFADRAQG